MVVVADMRNHRLALWRLSDGTVWKHLGSQGTEPGQFYYPRAVAVTSTGALVVTDEHRVQVLTVDGAVLCVLDPTAVAGVGRLGYWLPGVAVCAGTDEILVADSENNRVVALMWSPSSNVRRPFCSSPGDVGGLFSLKQIHCIGACCTLVQGTVGTLHDARTWGTDNDDSDDGSDEDQVVAPALGQLNKPHGVVVMSSGGVWVVDSKNHRICLLH